MTEFANQGGLGEDDATTPVSIIRPGGLRRRQVVLAFNAAPIVDVLTGDRFAMVLTGNIVVGVPVFGGGVMAAAHAGMEVMFDWIQDGAGSHTIGYNAIFLATTGASQGIPAILTTLSTRTIDLWEWDGVHWRLLSRVTGQ